MRFNEQEDLRKFLADLGELYPQYCAALWDLGLVRSTEELAVAPEAELRCFGVQNGMHIAWIKAAASASTAAAQRIMHWAVGKEADGDQGTVSAYALLAQGYQPLVFTGSSSSSTLASGAHVPKWTVSAEQVQQELQHLHRVRVQPPSTEPQSSHQCEESCRDAFRDQALAPVNRVLRVEGQSMEYRKPGTSILSGGEPDFTADVMAGRLSTGAVVVGEAKTPQVLEDVTDDLTGTMNVTNLRETIGQVWGYLMASLGDPEGGFFGTTDRTWFFRADRASQAMYVTDAVHCRSESPSVRQMLYLLLRVQHLPLPTDAVQWAQQDLNRILIDPIRQEGWQGPAGGGQQQGGGQQGGRPGAVTRSRSKAMGASKQHVAGVSTSTNIVPIEDFQDRVPIGSGETGTVCAAWLHGRRVAVKTSDCYNRKDVVRRLMNEVDTYKALQRLQGICIPRLEEHGYTMWGGAYFVATQLISGRTHEEGREVSVTQKRAAEQALAAIHAGGYLHGDVRGDNLIFEEGTGKVFFLDLGFSKACSCNEDFQAEIQGLRELLLPSPTTIHKWPHI